MEGWGAPFSNSGSTERRRLIQIMRSLPNLIFSTNTYGHDFDSPSLLNPAAAGPSAAVAFFLLVATIRDVPRRRCPDRPRAILICTSSQLSPELRKQSMTLPATGAMCPVQGVDQRNEATGVESRPAWI